MTKRAERALWEATRTGPGVQQPAASAGQCPARPQRASSAQHTPAEPSAGQRQAPLQAGSWLAGAAGSGVRAGEVAADAGGASSGAGTSSKRRRLSPDSWASPELQELEDAWDAGGVSESPDVAAASRSPDEPFAVDSSAACAPHTGQPGGVKCVLSDSRVVIHADVDSFYCQARPAATALRQGLAVPQLRRAAASRRARRSSSSSVTLSSDTPLTCVQVERLDDPSLVGVPLAVRQFNSGGFVACSYEVPPCSSVLTTH